MDDALKVRTLRAVTVASAPVLGLRPTRSRFDRSLKLPRTDFHGLAPYKRLSNLLEKRIEHLSGRRARQARAAAVNGFLQFGSRQGARILVFSSHVVHDNFWFNPASHEKRPPETPAAQVWEECPRRSRTRQQVYSDGHENLVHISRWDKNSNLCGGYVTYDR